jgi:hypothetical protein
MKLISECPHSPYAIQVCANPFKGGKSDHGRELRFDRSHRHFGSSVIYDRNVRDDREFQTKLRYIPSQPGEARTLYLARGVAVE